MPIQLPMLPTTTNTSTGSRGRLRARQAALLGLLGCALLLCTMNEADTRSSTGLLQVRRRMAAAAAANSATGRYFVAEKVRQYWPAANADGAETATAARPELLTAPCARWGVVTTIYEPNEAIVRASSLPSWCLVIVPDLITPPEDEYMEKLRDLIAKSPAALQESASNGDNVFFFSVEKQKEWEANLDGPFGNFVRATPWGHFARKNIGYLFAILHGAEFVFDFDDDNFVKLDADGMPLAILPPPPPPEEEQRLGLILPDVNVAIVGPAAFNHHPMMQASVEGSWARGFPIEQIQDEHTKGEVAYQTDLPFVSPTREVGVIQYLADKNPDVDAIHRFSKPLPMTFPTNDANSVLLPIGKYAPYNAQATVHTRNALWAMLLPSTVPGRVSDIWRSYFAECIFADSGLQVVFSPPKIVQERNEHNLRGDMNAEQDLYDKSGALIEFLRNWDSEQSTVESRTESLWIDLYEREFIEIEDVHSVQMWLSALKQAGYQFPPLKRRYRNVAVVGQFNYADSSSTVQDVTFWMQKMSERFATAAVAGPFTSKQMQIFNEMGIKAYQNEKCDRGFYTPIKNLLAAVQDFRTSSPPIEGVLIAHDDLLLNVTELSKGQYPFPTDEIIVANQFSAEPGDLNPLVGGYGDIRNLQSQAEIESASPYFYRIFPDGHFEDFMKTNSYDTFQGLNEGALRVKNWPFTEQCVKAQLNLVKDSDSSIYSEDDGSIVFKQKGQSDWAFIPLKYADAFEHAASLFLKHNVFLECALPNIVNMMRRNANAPVRELHLCTSWGPSRGTEEFLKMCIENEYQYGVVHPFKLGSKGYQGYSEAFDAVAA